MHVGVDGARRGDQTVTRDRPRVRADREVDAVGDVRVARPPDPGDPPVLDPDVRLHDAEERIEHDRARDDRVELALGGRAVVLGHPGAPVLRVAPERLVGRIREVALDPDPEVGVAQPDAVAGGRAVARRVLGARVPLRHPAEPPSLRTARGPPRASRPAPIAGSRPRAGRAGTRRPPRGRTSRCSFERQNGKCDDTRIGCSPRLVTVRWIRSRPGASSTSPSPNRIAPGPSAPAGRTAPGARGAASPPRGGPRRGSRARSPATPSITWSGRTASRPAAATSSNDAAAAAGRVHLVADERHRLGRVQPQSLRERRPRELGGGEDPEALFLGGGQLHRPPPASVPSVAMPRAPGRSGPPNHERRGRRPSARLPASGSGSAS